jgi:thermitase
MKRRLYVQLAAEVVATALVVGGAGIAIAAAPATSSSKAAPSTPVTRTSTRLAYAPGRVVVKFERGVHTAARARLERANHARVIGSIHDVAATVLQVSAGAETRVVTALKRSGKVVYAERDAMTWSGTTSPNDPYYPSTSTQPGQWGIPLTQADRVWDTTTGSSSTVIAIVDSGVASHPDLAGQLITGHNVLDGSSDTTDTNGHGTEVAGTAAAATNNGTGISGYCWSCKIMPIKIETGSTANQSDVASGITWAVDHGARVINLSLGSSVGSATLANAVTYAQQKGALLVAAAMNSGCDCPQYPAAYQGVISVAAANQIKSLYSYSDYGTWVDLAGPGQNVTTTLTDFSTGAQWGYQSIGGTSIAAPAVSAIAALLFTAAPSSSASQVTNALLSTTTPLSGSNLPAHGLVDAYAALGGLGITGSSASTAAPVNVSRPTISGTAQEGQTLTASAGTWDGAPTGYTYQWQRCDSTGAACASIYAATASSYLNGSADVGSTLRVKVTAANASGSATATSDATPLVAGSTSPPSPAPSPSPSPSATSTATTSWTFSGSLNQKTTSRSFSVTTSGSSLSAQLSYGKCSGLVLALKSASGTTVDQAPGLSPLSMTDAVTSGTWTYTVSGSCKTSFTLTVTAS